MQEQSVQLAGLAALAYSTGSEGDWEPHPFAPSLQRRVLLTKRDHGANVSIFMYRMTPGATAPEVPEHVHEDCDDISYVIAGSSEVEVEGQVFKMSAGSFLRIPKGKRHKVLTSSPDLIAINLFSPATV
jgi:quercetin dioxygenase-like cupin family protein